MDLLRGRVRAGTAAAESPHLGPPGAHPVVKVSGRGSARISVAGLACLKAGQPGRFFYRKQGHRLRPGTRRAMSEADYASLITAAHRYLNSPLVVVWDNLKCATRCHGIEWR